MGDHAGEGSEVAGVDVFVEADGPVGNTVLREQRAELRRVVLDHVAILIVEQMLAEDQPWPGISVFPTTFSAALHLSGRASRRRDPGPWGHENRASSPREWIAITQ